MPNDDLQLPEPLWIDGLADVAARYDGFAIDQFGVLHDGRRPYAGALDCLERLRANGKAVVVLSNSGKRAAPNEARLAAMGFPRSSYDELVTSGEVVWRALKARRGWFYRKAGDRCLLFSNDGDRSIVAGLDVDIVDDPRDATFILLAGIDDGTPPDRLEAAFEWGIIRGLPLICANPDRTRIAGDKLAPSCGTAAHEYERRGGRVRWVGKPEYEIYRACSDVFKKTGAQRIAAIGDSIQHDVVGGEEAGFDTGFVVNGIHREDFADATRMTERSARLWELGERYGALPDWVIDELKW